MTTAVARELEAWTVDGALGGAVTLVQPREGYRFSLDAVLLARFAAETPVDSVVDLGCGCGVVGLCVLALGGAVRLVGVDIQPAMVACAGESAQRSGLSGQSEFRPWDYRERKGFGGGFPLVVSNPPYRPQASGRISPRPGVAVARTEVCGDVNDLAVAAARALQLGGSFCSVYPAARLHALLAACMGAGLRPRVLRFVHPRQNQPARLALLRCSKGQPREGLEVRPPLVLHDGDAREFTAEAATLLGPP